MATTPQPVKDFTVDRLNVRVYTDRATLGAAAGTDVATKLRELLDHHGRVRMIFAAAPSQNEMLKAIAAAPGIDWSHVTAFHMDEYLGLPGGAPQRFSQYLRNHLFDLVRPGKVHLIDSANEVDAECPRYAALLNESPIDIVCLGIGENGHLAFNDPPVANFDDPRTIKPVELDLSCRQQQVNDGCFPSLDTVPTHALTLTIPALLSGAHLICCVPGPTKRAAIARTLSGAVSTECPSTVLRRHENCTLYVDRKSYGA